MSVGSECMMSVACQYSFSHEVWKGSTDSVIREHAAVDQCNSRHKATEYDSAAVHYNQVLKSQEMFLFFCKMGFNNQMMIF